MAANFQVDFQFEVDGKGDGIVGDGFAVWFTKERAEMGPVFGNRDRFEGLGIFFDTYANGRHSVSIFSLCLFEFLSILFCLGVCNGECAG
jgi:mannose-binding lectin 2